jgi:hypothetical protein
VQAEATAGLAALGIRLAKSVIVGTTCFVFPPHSVASWKKRDRLDTRSSTHLSADLYNLETVDVARSSVFEFPQFKVRSSKRAIVTA